MLVIALMLARTDAVSSQLYMREPIPKKPRKKNAKSQVSWADKHHCHLSLPPLPSKREQRLLLQDEKDMTDESFMAKAVKASTEAEEAKDLGDKVKSKSLEVGMVPHFFPPLPRREFEGTTMNPADHHTSTHHTSKHLETQASQRHVQGKADSGQLCIQYGCV